MNFKQWEEKHGSADYSEFEEDEILELAESAWNAAFKEGVRYALSADSRDVTMMKLKLMKEKS